jgi:hypothetical protein
MVVLVAVGAAAWEHAQDVDQAGAVALEADAPVTNAQPPFGVAAGELDDVTARRVAGEAIERVEMRR